VFDIKLTGTIIFIHLSADSLNRTKVLDIMPLMTAVIIRRNDWNDVAVPITAGGMGSRGTGTMQGFGNTAFAYSSKYATAVLDFPKLSLHE